MSYTFTDKMGRKITLDAEDSYDIKALYREKVIGSVEFDCIEDSQGNCYTQITNVNVDDRYRRAGIGLELMSLAAEVNGANFLKPRREQDWVRDAPSQSGYTEEGRALMDKCIEVGFIDDYLPTASDFDDYD